MKAELQEMLDEVKKLRDELKVKVHLAGMDAKETWKKLEPRVEELQKQAVDAGKKAADEVKASAVKLKEAFEALRKKMQGPPAS
jgi:transposase